MSEFRSYEFLALERPLSPKEMGELRAVSSRAEITPARFWNEYQWGALKADPAKLLARYFDAHLFFEAGGTTRLLLRLPKARVDGSALAAYFPPGRAARLVTSGAHVVVDLAYAPEDFEEDEESPPALAGFTSLRSELLAGDLRPAYLAWLLAVSAGDVDEDALEPAVPPGLSERTPAQEAMIDLLRIDVDLVAAAASGSAPLSADREPLRRWVVKLAPKEKDAWLRRAVDEPELPLGPELARAFRATQRTPRRAPRTVAALRALAESHATARERKEAAREKRSRAAAAAKRERHLAKLGKDVDAGWDELAKLIDARQDEVAMSLAVDLRELYTRRDAEAAFADRFAALRKALMRRRGFFDRWKRARSEGPRARG